MSSEETHDGEKYPKRPLDNAEDWEWMKYKDQMRVVWKERQEKKLKRQEEKKAKRRRVEAEENAALKAQQKTWRGRKYTVSVALPGSIMDNAQSPELRTYLAGQIARALVVFSVDEVVIFDETGSTKGDSTEGSFAGVGKKGQANVQLARILQYLECPQYLRKNFFPMHQDLKYAGLLNPLDCPHHLRADQKSPSGGMVSNYTPSKKKGSCVYIGLKKEARVDKQIQAGLRVTVQIDEDENVEHEGKAIQGTVVAPSLPREQQGIYWGYSVRLASSLGAVFSESPHPDGYDLTIGTSEKGENADDAQLSSFKEGTPNLTSGGIK
ncbi:hypothetical protein BSL78_05239 [Apostichopus japonicus]|uniref:SPOUT domain containing methyltransferase 1 n=1 Tax=Stichopus japonicus TaxID=307972 RepID=A0A2G8LC59_STIJA|nr:hypothetical protein BSL78_05239 [Apostichopus japonicus]